MPSKLKSETSRINGSKSHGPKTLAAKLKSSHNSLSHGFRSRNTIVLDYENPEEFQQMLAEFRETYRPGAAAENDLVDQMVAARWRVRRLWTIETALLDSEIVRGQSQVRDEYPELDGAMELALAFRELADKSRSLALVSRYESRLSRMHDRAYAALRELQNKKVPNEPIAPQVPLHQSNAASMEPPLQGSS